MPVSLSISRALLMSAAATAMALSASAGAQQSASPQASSATFEQLEKFMDVYARVKSNYVKDVDDETLINGAIDGMLSALDPHSSFAEGPAFDELRTLADGN